MTQRRKVLYVTGSRADFGLMQSTLTAIDKSPDLSLSLLVTGMHLDEACGNTIDIVRATNLDIAAVVPVEKGAASGVLMGRNVGRMLTSMVDAFAAHGPDIILLLGDRGEMLAAAIAALHLNLPTAHIHGGERSGTIDEPVRHAISKMAHMHLVATTESRDRLIRMGEDAERIHVVGAPGLDDLKGLANVPKEVLFERHHFDIARPLAMMVFHPVVQEAGQQGIRYVVESMVNVLLSAGLQVLALTPNSDAGSAEILGALEALKGKKDLHLTTNLQRAEYVSFLRHCDVLVGNSSSGIIEAASFGTPVVNIGSRQNLRQRNANVIDIEADELPSAIQNALSQGRFEALNVYGDGNAAARIVSAIRGLDLSSAHLLAKTNAY